MYVLKKKVLKFFSDQEYQKSIGDDNVIYFHVFKNKFGAHGRNSSSWKVGKKRVYSLESEYSQNMKSD